MHCGLCGSGRQAQFSGEINVHIRGLQNLDKPSVFVFPNITVCLDCGFSRFTLPKPGLEQLAGATPNTETSSQKETSGNSDSAGQNCA
jgi:hypothetical protein